MSDVDTDIRVSSEALRHFASDVLCRVGVPGPDAKLIARCLVEVDLRGIRSHGLRYLRPYVERYRAGLLNPKPQPRLIRDDNAAVVMDGDGGLGYIVATQATQRLIAHASETGLGVAATRNHGHVGSVGVYARLALEENFASISFAARSYWPPSPRPDPTVWDATPKSPVICIAIPSAGGPPLVVDMAANQIGNRKSLVRVNISTITYRVLALPGTKRHLDLNQEADDAQIKSIRYHAHRERAQGARSESAPVYVIVSRRGARQDRVALRRRSREQADRRAARHAASRREQVAQALLPGTPRRARGSFPQRPTLCFFPLAWSPR